MIIYLCIYIYIYIYIYTHTYVHVYAHVEALYGFREGEAEGSPYKAGELLTTSVVYWFTVVDMLFVLLNVLLSDLLYELFSTYAICDL